MLTARVAIPAAVSCSCAARINSTSEPVAMRITFGLLPAASAST